MTGASVPLGFYRKLYGFARGKKLFGHSHSFLAIRMAPNEFCLPCIVLKKYESKLELGAPKKWNREPNRNQDRNRGKKHFGTGKGTKSIKSSDRYTEF